MRDTALPDLPVLDARGRGGQFPAEVPSADSVSRVS